MSPRKPTISEDFFRPREQEERTPVSFAIKSRNLPSVAPSDYSTDSPLQAAHGVQSLIDTSSVPHPTSGTRSGIEQLPESTYSGQSRAVHSALSKDRHNQSNAKYAALMKVRRRLLVGILLMAAYTANELRTATAEQQ